MANSSNPSLAKTSSVVRFRLGPRGMAILSIVALAGLGWIHVGLMIAATPNQFMGQALFDALCGTGLASPGASDGATAALLVFAMWATMAAAMMLPTASGTVLAYADIAEAAAVPTT